MTDHAGAAVSSPIAAPAPPTGTRPPARGHGEGRAALPVSAAGGRDLFRRHPPPVGDPGYTAWARARRDELAAAVAIMPGWFRRRTEFGRQFVTMLAAFDEYLEVVASRAAKEGAE